MNIVVGPFKLYTVSCVSVLISYINMHLSIDNMFIIVGCFFVLADVLSFMYALHMVNYCRLHEYKR